jgi:iron complex outermembrane receptor protein
MRNYARMNEERANIDACDAAPQGRRRGPRLPAIRAVVLGLGLLALPAGIAAQSSAPVPTRQETIIVTGTPLPIPLEEADRSVSLLPVRESSDLVSSWAGLAQVDPSLDFAQRAPHGVQGDLSIRGAGFNQSLVLVNGFRVNDAQVGHHNLDLPLPLLSLDRIEVLHGAGSTLYGADAVGGAVNFIVTPPAVSEFRLGAAVGNFGTNTQFGSAAYASPRLGEQLSFSRDFSSGFTADRDYRSLALSSITRIATRLGDSSVLLGLSDRPFGAAGFYGDYPSWERTKAWLATLRQPLGERTEFDLGYRRHTDDFVLYRDDPAIYENNHITESWQVALRRNQSLGHGARLLYGVEGYRDAIASTNLGRHARNRGAAYGDFDFRAWRRYSFTLGVREELYGGGQSEVSPMASAGVWLSGKLKLRATASHGFRVPTYTELYYSQPGLVGNATLKPESAWNYEAGFDWHPGTRVTAMLTGFHRRERNDIDYVMPVGGTTYTAENIDRLNFTGAEASLRLDLTAGQRVDFSYTGIAGSQAALAGLITRYSGNYPSSYGVVAWQGRLPGKIVARSRLGVLQRRSQSGPYALWDVAARRQFQRFTAFVQLANLTDATYQEIPGVAMPGRSVLGGVEFVLTGKAKK